jgi:hypothetical protein
MEMIADPERLRAIDLRALGSASEADDGQVSHTGRRER